MSNSPNLGGCKMEKVLSRSQHSDLYKAVSEELQRPVMIKILSPRYPSGSRTARRFLRGGKLAMSLEHPNIVRTFSAGEDRGRPYMLLEYLDGHSLDRILDVKELLPWEMATGIVRQIAKALEAANERNIVHRAIEPSHIMLSPGGRATVLGFGLARESEPADASITSEGALVNVGPYSPPETGEGILDQRADLYSLGCVYFHLVSGRPPFAGREPLELLRMHRTEVPWPLSDLVPDIHPGIAELINMLLQKSPSDRLQSATELISMIDAAINPEILGAQGIKPDKTMVTSTLQILAARGKFTVLLCDSNKEILHFLKETLRRLGISILTTRDGQAAIDTLASRKIDVVITDMKLPGLCGEKLIDRIRATSPECRIIINRTGEYSRCLYESRNYPIVACLERPLDVFSVRQLVKETLAAT